MIYLFQVLLLVLSVSFGIAKPGFYPKNHSEIPSNISQKAEAVFYIIPLCEGSCFNVPASEYSACAEGTRKGNIFRQLVCKELRECDRQNLKECPVPYLTSGTAFLAEAPDTLYTAFHVFEKFYVKAIGEGSVLETPINFLLYNDEDTLVLDTRTLAEKTYASVCAPPMKYLENYIHSKGLSDLAPLPPSLEPLDFMQIKLATELPYLPLNVLSEPLVSGTDLYIAGYPMPSEDREKKYGVPDSDGVHFSFTKGKAINSVQALEIKNAKSLIAKNQFIVSDADGLPGMSGGPILNGAGEVVGVFTTIPTAEENAPLAEYRSMKTWGPSIYWMKHLIEVAPIIKK